MTKETVQHIVNERPNEFSLDDLVERLILLQSFEQGRQEYRDGKTLTHEEVGERLRRWLK